MKIKLNKNAFLKLIFINLMIINIKSELKDNAFFTCPSTQDNYKNLSFNAQCKRLEQLFNMLNDEKIYEASKNEDLEAYSNITRRISANIKDSDFNDFLKYIKKYGDEKTKQFFMLSEEDTKGEETK